MLLKINDQSFFIVYASINAWGWYRERYQGFGRWHFAGVVQWLKEAWLLGVHNFQFNDMATVVHLVARQVYLVPGYGAVGRIDSTFQLSISKLGEIWLSISRKYALYLLEMIFYRRFFILLWKHLEST